MKVLTLETVTIEPISSIEDQVYVEAIVDDGGSTQLMWASFSYVPSEWPIDEQFQPTSGKPTQSQSEWLAALGDWQTVPNEDY
tara:strand:- start:570 stop:818 length:249 start_codon:yes stop_codon:yes gene_type:complete